MFKKLLAKTITKFKNLPNKVFLDKLEKQELLTIGEGTYGRNNLIIDIYKGSEAKVIIGKYCSISKHVRLITGGIHPMNWVSTFPFRAKLNLKDKYTDGMPYTKGDIMIGNDVWLGTDIIIMSGVKVGHGSIITAGSIVTKDVEPYAIVGGVPANTLKYRFTQEQIQQLLKMAWWDWDKEKIKQEIGFLNNLL